MDSHKTTSNTLSQLPGLFSSLDVSSIQAHQIAVDQTLAAQHARLTNINSHYESLAKKHNELVACYTDRVAILSQAQSAMKADITTLKTETSEIKGMVSDILQLLKPTQAPLVSSSTAATTDARATVEG